MTDQAQSQNAVKTTNKSSLFWTIALLLLVLFPSGAFAADKLLSVMPAHSSPVRIYDATAAREAAVVYSWETAAGRVQVYDATAAREAAIVYANEAVRHQPIVYDATAAMLSAITPSKPEAVSFSGNVYDATEAMFQSVVFPTYP